jgi:hypothetical protein
VLTLRTRWLRAIALRDQQIDTLRSMLNYCEMLANLMAEWHPESHEREYLADTISNGESLLKELGGCAIR